MRNAADNDGQPTSPNRLDRRVCPAQGCADKFSAPPLEFDCRHSSLMNKNGKAMLAPITATPKQNALMEVRMIAR
jgi:hypothetical protein